MNDICEVHWLGEVEYQRAWDLQNRYAGEIGRGERRPTLLLLEHPHTFTLGKRGKREHLLWDEAQQAQKGVAVHWVDRGGDITYHGPGQLVGYPLLPLAPPGWQGESLPVADFGGYLRKLESVLIRTLAFYGIPSGQREGLTGVWVPADVRSRCLRCEPGQKPAPAKIASIGVKVDVKGVSRHGFALNVQPDMEYWQGIIPCGIDSVVMGAMADFFEEPPSVRSVAEKLITVFGEVFSYKMQVAEPDSQVFSSR